MIIVQFRLVAAITMAWREFDTICQPGNLTWPSGKIKTQIERRRWGRRISVLDACVFRLGRRLRRRVQASPDFLEQPGCRFACIERGEFRSQFYYWQLGAG